MQDPLPRLRNVDDPTPLSRTIDFFRVHPVPPLLRLFLFKIGQPAVVTDSWATSPHSRPDSVAPITHIWATRAFSCLTKGSRSLRGLGTRTRAGLRFLRQICVSILDTTSHGRPPDFSRYSSRARRTRVEWPLPVLSLSLLICSIKAIGTRTCMSLTCVFMLFGSATNAFILFLHYISS